MFNTFICKSWYTELDLSYSSNYNWILYNETIFTYKFNTSIAFWVEYDFEIYGCYYQNRSCYLWGMVLNSLWPHTILSWQFRSGFSFVLNNFEENFKWCWFVRIILYSYTQTTSIYYIMSFTRIQKCMDFSPYNQSRLEI